MNTPDMADLSASLRPAVEAVELAVTHGHNLLLIANPGMGATMIARRVPSIMPAMTEREARWVAIERAALGFAVTGPYSARAQYGTDRPFRAPHHSVSTAALVGARGRAGEIHLARFGVLYLDELPEFRLSTIERLAYELRSMHGAPLVIASAAPCPCGWLGTGKHRSRPVGAPNLPTCVCSAGATRRYTERLRKLWGGFWRASGGGDTVRIPSISLKDLRTPGGIEPSATIAARIGGAR